MKNLFKFSGKWHTYNEIVNNPWWSNDKNILENMWEYWHRYTDQDKFIREIAENENVFNQRIWEMVLGCSLKDRGHSLLTQKEAGVINNKGGPDICISLPDGGKLWVECTCPERGSGQNGVPEMKFEEIRYDKDGKALPLEGRGYGPEVNRQIILRYTSAIEDKSKKIKDYQQKRIIMENDGVVIAVNSANIMFEDPIIHDFPLIVKSCYGIEDQCIILGKSNYDSEIKVLARDYRNRRYVKKYTDAGSIDINSAIFLSDRYVLISAVIFSYFRFTRISDRSQKFIVIHNPFARNPIRIGTLKAEQEYWLEEIQYSCYDKTVIDQITLRCEVYDNMP